MPKRKRGATCVRTTELPLPKSMIFPFLELPAEIRNSIYGYSFSVDPHRLHFCLGCLRVTGITTSFLTVNKQIYAEALPFLYNGPMLVPIRTYGCLPFRKDQDTRGSRSLRSGKQVSMTSFRGLIYPHVLARFRRLKISLNMSHLLHHRLIHVGNANLIFLAQLQEVMEVLAPIMQPSFQGPRVQELEISVDDERLLSSVLGAYGSREKLASFTTRQRRLLEPFSQLWGLKSVKIDRVKDRTYMDQLKRIMESDGSDRVAARKALIESH